MDRLKSFWTQTHACSGAHHLLTVPVGTRVMVEFHSTGLKIFHIQHPIYLQHLLKQEQKKKPNSVNLTNVIIPTCVSEFRNQGAGCSIVQGRNHRRRALLLCEVECCGPPAFRHHWAASLPCGHVEIPAVTHNAPSINGFGCYPTTNCNIYVHCLPS